MRKKDAKRHLTGKKKLALHVYEAQCLAKIAELEIKMESLDRKNYDWGRLARQRQSLLARLINRRQESSKQSKIAKMDLVINAVL